MAEGSLKDARLGRADSSGSSAREPRPGAVRIGISGWTYRPWRGVFYPEGLPQRLELHYASRQVESIEINGTHYRLQNPASFAKWKADTPDDFIFSVKGSRFITHMKRLRAIEQPLAKFFASGLLGLGAKLGPILWQFPPNFRFDPDLLDGFLTLLPRDTGAAAELIRVHAPAPALAPAPTLREAAEAGTGHPRKIHHAVEIRHDSFRDPAFIALLRHHKVALVCADTVSWPRLMDLTAEFVYCRLHGSEELYASGYDEAAIGRWASRVAAWARGGEPGDAERVVDRAAPKSHGRDVFVYFDNDMKIRAPFDAAALRQRVSALLDA